MKVTVQCTFVIEVDDFPEDWSDEDIRFNVEDNSCPGTSWVGSAVDAVMEQTERDSYCWACRLQGENKVLKIER